MSNFALKGHLLYAPNQTEIVCLPNHYLVCEDGKVAGAFPRLPECYQGIPVEDYDDRMIVPGFVDLHLHAPQYAFRGLDMNQKLLAWLNAHVFPEEARYSDLVYAARAYRVFAEALKISTTTRACIFATIHTDATLLLMELLEETGVIAKVGKVNMDVNCPDYYGEDTLQSLAETARWLERSQSNFENISPILTPRFAPVCSARLMSGLADLQQKFALPLQSHLSENPVEVAWAQSLFPDCSCYGDIYDRFGLFGSNGPIVMAHCVYSGADEVSLMRERGVFIAHCPQSNINLASGIAPVRAYLDDGLKMGLGSDIAGGFSLSGFRAMSDAIQVSKLHWCLMDQGHLPLLLEEAFYLLTKGGGEFFGKVGSFETGYEFDVLVLDDAIWPSLDKLDLKDRLERLVYLSDDRCIVQKYVAGNRIFA